MPANYKPDWFDPLSTKQIGNTICEIFERQPLASMASEIPKFEGSGLYALYYRGTTVTIYTPLNSLQIPVYVGKAHHSNTATGERKRDPYPLRTRLRQHRQSIIEASLPIEEFRFRALRLPDVHADLGEDALRVGYKPVWNSKLRGFGSKEQGSTTRKSQKSPWDTVHDGRKRTHGGVFRDAEKLLASASEHITKQVSDYDRMPWPHPSSVDVYVDL